MSGDPDKIREALYAIPPEPFEHFIADLWDRQGWDTSVTDHHADRGVDIVATRTDAVVAQQHVIQAKRYQSTNVVGRPELQQYYSLRDQEGADAVVIATTSRFSSQAEAWADEYNLKLVDGAALAELVGEIGATSLLEHYSESAFAKDAAGPPARDRGGQSSREHSRPERYSGIRGLFRTMYDIIVVSYKSGYRGADNEDDSDQGR
ncbi:restriction endonuclease [Natronomonas sp. LN261]|uniref:restriction endonuclease n=1 Tax=Natronomonas sp. LN261 TaxID=2750669 RepID=UPI0015EE5FA0